MLRPSCIVKEVIDLIERSYVWICIFAFCGLFWAAVLKFIVPEAQEIYKANMLRMMERQQAEAK